VNEASATNGRGRITASPDPLTWDPRVRLTLSWETSPPQPAEIFVSENQDAEKLVGHGESGSCELDWIRSGTDYEFRLYSTGQARGKLDTVTVRRNAIPWRSLLNTVGAVERQPNEEGDEMAEFIAGTISRYLRDPRFPEWFRLWEAHGFHVTPVHFYEPIPDTRSLDKELWARTQELVAVDMNRGVQLDLLSNVFPQFQPEFEAIPRNREEAEGGFFVNNGRFERLDPVIAYCMVRHFRPSRIIEIGGGYSTLLLAMAGRENGNTSLTCIEPYPDDFLRNDVPGLKALLPKKVEDVELSFFERLKAGDLLFIDSSHVLRIGGDVNFLFQEILPRLNPGVIVHLHDIFLPSEYPWKWVMERHRFWTEQYLLQAFLSFNAEFEVLLGVGYLEACCNEELNAVFPDPPSPAGGSFWMRRRPRA
jgi:hypothetical protein